MYAEGEPCKKIWIILEGEVKIEKRVNIAHKNAHDDTLVLNLLHNKVNEKIDCENVETTQFFLQTLSKGQIIGLEDPNLKEANYITSAIVSSQTCDFYSCDREAFLKIVAA